MNSFIYHMKWINKSNVLKLDNFVNKLIINDSLCQ